MRPNPREGKPLGELLINLTGKNVETALPNSVSICCVQKKNLALSGSRTLTVNRFGSKFSNGETLYLAKRISPLSSSTSSASVK